MELALETVLQQRSRQLASRLDRKRSVMMSAGLHLVLMSSLILLPILLQDEPEPIEFTPIMIVPVQALGVENPVAPPTRSEAPPKPEPEPEPAPREAMAEPETPTLPEPEAKPTRKPAASEPAPVRETGPERTGAQQGAMGQRQGSASGSSLGTSVFGAAVGGLDNPDFVYGYYVDQMLAMIGAQWRRPPLGAQIEAVIHFRIHSDGHISDVRVLQSSGYNSYDLAGLRAIQTAAPFPKLPQSFRHKSLGVRLILR